MVAAALVLCGPAVATPQSDDLPDGEGKRILQTSCTACHELTEVTKFKGYYTRDEWRDVVKTMVEYGAVVKPDDVDVLVDYLAKNFGKKPG
jgi:cytochrome c5